jgi:hypothetical protein
MFIYMYGCMQSHFRGGVIDINRGFASNMTSQAKRIMLSLLTKQSFLKIHCSQAFRSGRHIAGDGE